MNSTPDGIVTKRSAHGVTETVERLRGVLTAKSLNVFAIIDHSGEAARVGLTMPDTKVVIFGNPQAGTPIMLSSSIESLRPISRPSKHSQTPLSRPDPEPPGASMLDERPKRISKIGAGHGALMG